MQTDKSVKIKFYLRGLATGIVVATALTFLVSPKTPEGEKKSAEVSRELEARGKSTENSKPEETQETAESTAESMTESTEPEETQETAESTAESMTESAEPEETQETAESTAESMTESAEPEETREIPESTAPDFVTITISKGNSSETVAKKLADAGLVPDARKYDHYLCEHGYDKRISVGTFQIAPGASEEEIAKTITNSK